MPARALIVEAGFTRSALAGARALATAGWEVGVAAARPRGLAAASNAVTHRHHVPPAGSGAGPFVAAVAEVVRDFGYEVVLAAGDAELLALSARRDEVGAAVPHAAHDAVLRSIDKQRLTEAAQGSGVAVPRTWRPEDEWPADLPHGAVVKARLHWDPVAERGSGPFPTVPAAGASQARAAVERMRSAGGDPILQERVVGGLMAWSCVFDPARGPLCRVQQVADRVWPPGAGVTARGRTVAEDPELARGAERLLAALGWTGLAELQFLIGDDGVPRLIDLNGRLYGSLSLAVAAGANLPAVWVAQALDRPLPACVARPGVTYQWLAGDLGSVVRGGEGAAGLARLVATAPRATHSIWRLRDPRPAMRYLGDTVGRRLSGGQRERLGVTDGPLGTIAPDGPAAALVTAAVGEAADAAGALARLRSERVPPAAAAAVLEVSRPALVGDPAWAAAVEADLDRGQRIQRAVELTAAALAEIPASLPGASLGYLWSSDVDVLVDPGRLEDAAAGLERAGFVSLDGLLARLGRSGRGRRFAAVEDGVVLAPVELEPAAAEAIARARAASPGEALPPLADRDAAARRLAKIAGQRHVTLRARLELMALGRSRVPLSARAAWPLQRVRGMTSRFRAAVRPRRIRLAFSGIDGSGKSTQAEMLVETLARLGVPAVAIWNRIGWGSSAPLVAAARLGQRVLPAGSHSAQRDRATGAAAERARAPVTRRGIVGWAWALTGTVDYLLRPLARIRRARGSVVVFDRGLPDALIGLEEEYGGSVDLRLHRRLVRAFGQRPDLVVYLRISGAEAMARKNDLFAEEILTAHARRYDEELEGRPGVLTVDARRDAAQISLEVLRRLAR